MQIAESDFEEQNFDRMFCSTKIRRDEIRYWKKIRGTKVYI